MNPPHSWGGGAKRRRGGSILFIAAGLLLLWSGWFVLGFLDEPSAVGNLRIALIGVGAGSLALGLTCGLAGAWILVRRSR